MMKRALAVGLFTVGLAFSGAAFAQTGTMNNGINGGAQLGVGAQTGQMGAQTGQMGARATRDQMGTQRATRTRGLSQREMNRNTRNRAAMQRSMNRNSMNRTNRMNSETRGLPTNRGTMGSGTMGTGMGPGIRQ